MPLTGKDGGCPSAPFESFTTLRYSKPSHTHPPNNQLFEFIDASAYGKYVGLCKIVNGICVTVLDRRVEKATIGLHPVVVSIKDFTVRYIYYP